MAVHKHLFSLFSLLSLALVLASFESTPVNALSLEHHQHYGRSFHQHNSLAKKKRSTMQKRCKSRPTPSSAPVSASSPAPPASSNKVGAAAPGSSPAPAKQSSAAPAPPSSSPSPSPQSKPSSSPAPSQPQSTSSSSVAQRLKAIFPNKSLGPFGGSPAQLSEWAKLDTYYNWGVQPTGPGGPMFIPMFWGNRNQGVWQSDVVNAKTVPPIVKTFNECEISSQCNMSPQDAASSWNQNILPVIKRGSIVGCPAVTSDPGAKPWLDAFFSSCNNGLEFCGCTYMDVHYYGTDTGEFITWIQGMQKQYTMPMMVSEFACQSFVADQPQCDPGQVLSFAATMTQFFESTDYIFAYGPFGIMTSLGNVNPDNGLMNPNGSPNSLALTYFPSLG